MIQSLAETGLHLSDSSTLHPQHQVNTRKIIKIIPFFIAFANFTIHFIHSIDDQWNQSNIQFLRRKQIPSCVFFLNQIYNEAYNFPNQNYCSNEII